MAQNRLISAIGTSLPYFLVGIMVVMFAIPTYFYVTAEQIMRDAEFCIKDKILPQHDIVLVDATDELSDEYIQAIKTLINNKILKSLPADVLELSPADVLELPPADVLNPLTADILKPLTTDGKLTIISFNGDVEKFINKRFSRCNLDDGRDANELLESKKRLLINWWVNFRLHLDKFLVELENLPPAETTPLLEMLAMISKYHDFSPDVKTRRIFIYSDLFQYRFDSPNADFYKSNLNFDVFSKTKYFNDLTIDLTGVEIVILRVLRPEKVQYQGEKQKDFWYNLLIKGWNAESVKFY